MKDEPSAFNEIPGTGDPGSCHVFKMEANNFLMMT
jgi:hypothetical protein